MFKPGQKIKAGYHVEITTWENDGDHYNSKYFDGLTIEEANDLIGFCARFKSQSDHGNEDISTSEIVGLLIDLYHSNQVRKEFIGKYFELPEPPALDCTDDEYDAYLLEHEEADDLMECLHTILGSPIEYDYNFARQVDSVKVRHFETDFEIPELPEVQHKFDGSYQARNSQQVWKIQSHNCNFKTTT